MIKFALRCGEGHAFDSWFRDSDAFDQLIGHSIACPTCGSTDISKALMAPAVVTSRQRRNRAPQPTEARPEPTASQDPAVLTDEKAQAFRAMLRAMRDHVVQNSKDVGQDFAGEARRIHEGVAEETAIRGLASHDEVKGLLEDGIEVMPLPVFPDERN